MILVNEYGAATQDSVDLITEIVGKFFDELEPILDGLEPSQIYTLEGIVLSFVAGDFAEYRLRRAYTQRKKD